MPPPLQKMKSSKWFQCIRLTPHPVCSDVLYITPSVCSWSVEVRYFDVFNILSISAPLEPTFQLGKIKSPNLKTVASSFPFNKHHPFIMKIQPIFQLRALLVFWTVNFMLSTYLCIPERWVIPPHYSICSWSSEIRYSWCFLTSFRFLLPQSPFFNLGK